MHRRTRSQTSVVQQEEHLGHAQFTEGILQVAHDDVEVLHAQALLIVQPAMTNRGVLANVLVRTPQSIGKEFHLRMRAKIGPQ